MKKMLLFILIVSCLFCENLFSMDLKNKIIGVTGLAIFGVGALSKILLLKFDGCQSQYDYASAKRKTQQLSEYYWEAQNIGEEFFNLENAGKDEGKIESNKNIMQKAFLLVKKANDKHQFLTGDDQTTFAKSFDEVFNNYDFANPLACDPTKKANANDVTNPPNRLEAYILKNDKRFKDSVSILHVKISNITSEHDDSANHIAHYNSSMRVPNFCCVGGSSLIFLAYLNHKYCWV